MFSPDADISASASARNPRRRQRTGSEDSVTLRHHPKRIRRSILNAEAFQPLEATKQNGHVGHVAEELNSNGHMREPGNQRHSSGDATNLALRHRGSKKGDRGRRISKNDSSIELIKNENYVVTQLRTTPESLQDYDTTGKWRGEVSSSLGYALAMTHGQAIVWRYGQKNTPAESTKPINIRLLHPSNNSRYPLPLGILVPTSAEPAFLVVMPTSGKITYWESLTSAASPDANRQKQQSVQGVVQGLMSGESITKITEAEPRGFVLSFNTGRLAHLIVSDPQGKSSINVHFLRDDASSVGGVFGSLRNVFSGAGWRRDVAAVRAGSSYQRGQRYMVTATTKGVFQIWDLNWNGAHALVNAVDSKGDLLQALTEAADAFRDHEEHVFEVLDFTMLDRKASGKTLAKAKQISDCKLMVMTVLKGAESSRYALIGLTLANGSVTIDVVHPITCYKASIPAETDFRPQIIVSETAQMAFAVFERSLVLVSLAEVDETPSSQLQMEAHTLPDPFQDAIDFRKTKPYRVVGCASELHDRSFPHPSCTIMIYGFGVVRVAALPLQEGQSASERATVTAKTKMEQAVFYGTLQQDLFDFTPRPEIEFSQAEIGAAALSVNQSIMDSTSSYISALGPSMDQQLQRRSTALTDLNRYLRKHYQGDITRVVKWKLLWSAEKMASAKAIWHRYNSAVNNPQRGVDGKNLLAELIEAMSEAWKNENQPERHETDGVRHWFIHDIWRLEHILPWAQNMVEMLFQEGMEDKRPLDLATQVRLVSEANDIQLAGLETAFKFRETNAAAYGLGDETMMDGVLQRGYEELPEFWTSKASIVERVKALTDLSRELTKFSEQHEGDDEDSPSEELIDKLAGDNPRQVQICCQTYIERFRWLKSRKDPQSKAAGEDLTRAHFTIRKQLFSSLADVGQLDEGIRLAEKYQDMEALAEIVHQELLSTRDLDLIQTYEKMIQSYFTKFGTIWANAYFTKHLDGGRAVTLLTNNVGFKDHLTKFLRSHPAYAKLSWINEVSTEKDYIASANNLVLAERQEANLWSKKIGLSMSKLSLMAATSLKQVKDESAKPIVRGINENMAVLKTQEKLYKHMKPTLRDALDAEAEIDLAMEKYGFKFVKDKPILQKNLKQRLQKSLAMEALSFQGLIDILTLIDEEGLYPDEEGVMDIRFLSALKVLRLSNIEATDPGHKDLLEKIIWRRCMIQDDWADINRTELKNDTQVEVETGATSLFKTLKEGYSTEFWDQHAPLPPSSLTEAGTTIESLKTSSHFSNMSDSALELLARDLESEVDLLEQYIEKGRLEEWWRGVADAARAAARAEADEEGETKLRKRKMQEAFEERQKRIDEEGAKRNGGVRVDEQGDVVMTL